MAQDLATLSIKVDASQAKQELGGLEGALGKVKTVAAALGVTLGAGAIFKKIVDESSQAQYALAQLEARIKSTGAAAGQSVEELTAFAGEMQRITTYSDEAVMSAQALLLTFTNIRGDVFPGATKAALNLATAMGGDVKSAALQLGKALQDPEQGLTALRRSGVSFSDAQAEVIKQLFATGQQAKAQQMILAELEVEFGGAAEAARNTLGGALAGLKNQWGELFEVSRGSSGQIIAGINAITRVLPMLRDGFEMAIGGARLYYVQLVEAVQRGNAFLKEAFAWLVEKVAMVATVVPGYQQAAAQMLVAAAGLRSGAETTRAAFKAWRAEQEALIVGMNAGANAAKSYAMAAGELADNLQRAGRARQAATPTLATAEGLGALPGVSGDLQRQNWLRVFAFRQEAGRRAIEAELEAEAAAEAKKAQLRENFLRQWQQTFANGIANMLENGLSSWRDFFGSIKSLFLKLVADMAAAKLTEKLSGSLLGAFGMGGEGKESSGRIFGLSAGTAAGIAGVGLAVVGFVSEMQAQSDRARQAQIEFARATAAWELSFADFVGQFSASAIEKQLADIRKQGIALADAATSKASGAGYSVNTPLGSANEIRQFVERYLPSASGAAGVLKDELLRVADAMDRNAEAARHLQAEQDDTLRFDLRARQLRAAGMDAEADALALWNRHREEWFEAGRKGYSEELLAELARTQAMEKAALAARQAAEEQQKLADAQRVFAEQAARAAEQIAAAQQRAAEHAQRLADATDDLGVRLLRAQGKAEEADRRAFELEQSRELRAAQNEARELEKDIRAIKDPYGPGQQIGEMYYPGQFQYASVAEYQAAQFEKQQLVLMLAETQKYITELKMVQAAEAGAFGRGAVLPGATAGAPGTSGSFNTIVSRTTAVQGDRLVDEAVASRVLQQTYLPYLKVIADNLSGGVNRLLGAALQGDLAVAGSGVVS